MLDEQDRAAGRDALDQVDGLVRLRRRHPGERLIEQEHRRIAREDEPDLETALVAVREVFGASVARVPQADVVEDAFGRGAQIAEPSGEEEARLSVVHGLHGEAHVLVDGKVAEDVGDLERARDAETRALVGRERRDVAVFEPDAACRSAGAGR